MAEARRVSTLRIVIAFLLDLLTAFLLLGYAIGLMFGGATGSGFQLEGWTAILLLVAIVAYFVVFDRYLGGTIWKRLLGAVR